MNKVFDSNIKIIGIESSEDRKNLDFNKEEIAKAGKFLRIGAWPELKQQKFY